MSSPPMTKKPRPKKITLYLGWDGSYVLSKYPLTVHIDHIGGEDTKYLSTDDDAPKFSITDIDECSGRPVFGDLKLKKWEVVKLELVVKRKAFTRAKPKPKAKK